WTRSRSTTPSSHGLDVGRRFTEVFRGSRVQIPPSRLGDDQASLRLPRWGFFLVPPRVVSSVVSGAAPSPPGDAFHTHRNGQLDSLRIEMVGRRRRQV